MELTVAQQHLFNYFKIVYVTTKTEALDVLKEIMNTNVDNHNLANEIFSLNKVIKQYDFEIVECFCEITSEKLLILVNTTNDEITQ